MLDGLGQCSSFSSFQVVFMFQGAIRSEVVEVELFTVFDDSNSAFVGLWAVVCCAVLCCAVLCPNYHIMQCSDKFHFPVQILFSCAVQASSLFCHADADVAPMLMLMWRRCCCSALANGQGLVEYETWSPTAWHQKDHRWASSSGGNTTSNLYEVHCSNTVMFCIDDALPEYSRNVVYGPCEGCVLLLHHQPLFGFAYPAVVCVQAAAKVFSASSFSSSSALLYFD